jgi:hypothetical protein
MAGCPPCGSGTVLTQWVNGGPRQGRYDGKIVGGKGTVASETEDMRDFHGKGQSTGPPGEERNSRERDARDTPPASPGGGIRPHTHISKAEGSQIRGKVSELGEPRACVCQRSNAWAGDGMARQTEKNGGTFPSRGQRREDFRPREENKHGCKRC